jgi:hypothetical protein
MNWQEFRDHAPWTAPEWHVRVFSSNAIRKMDIYSLGMVCLWVVIQKGAIEVFKHVKWKPFRLWCRCPASSTSARRCSHWNGEIVKRGPAAGYRCHINWKVKRFERSAACPTCRILPFNASKGSRLAGRESSKTDTDTRTGIYWFHSKISSLHLSQEISAYLKIMSIFM